MNTCLKLFFYSARKTTEYYDDDDDDIQHLYFETDDFMGEIKVVIF